jgi:serine/threonine protein kinase/tetratricopeptide (TPR) repeat protein
MQEQSIFIEAMEKEDPVERAAFLDQACAGNSALRQRIERLLRRHEQDDGFLESPALAQVAGTPELLADGPGTQIGPYKLLELIGEGGFGLVLMAEQQQPIRRKVAVKVLKPGMDTRQVIARFEAERQALALMDHPNIARVLDAGQTSSGRPFFVMELVRGVPITEYCDENSLTPRERLELFMPVCQAVQHAHQKGIIHRDLKPTNVLVTLHDGMPVPKVIDFGIAKALGRQLTDKTLYTGFAQMIGTPTYMSPEQAAMSGLDVDTRSDIYALGVLLYELLTGTTPFDKKRLGEASYEELLRIIREEEPPKPSTRISTLGQAATTLSTQRKGDPRRLSRLFRGELDWIVMKCLEKDRNRRYDTASGLAADIQHYLHDEPVRARRPTVWSRVQKWSRRHRGVVSTAVVSGVLAVLALAVSTVLIYDQWKRAKKSAATAEAINDFWIKQVLAQASPRNNPGGADMTVRQLLDTAAAKFDQDNTLVDEPEVETAIRLTIGGTYNDLGLFHRAEPHLRRAWDICCRVLGPEHPQTLTARIKLAEVIYNQGKRAEADTYFQEILPAARRVLGEEHRDVIYIQTRLAMGLQTRDRFAEAEALFRQCLDAQRRVLGAEHEDTLDTLGRLGFLLAVLQGRFAEGELLCRQSWEAKARVLGKDHLWTLQGHGWLGGGVLFAEGRCVDAEQLFRQNLSDCRRAGAAGPEHEITLNAMNNLSGILIFRGKVTEAEQLLRPALETLLRVYGQDHWCTREARFYLAHVLRIRGQLDEAERLFRTQVEVDHRVFGSADWRTLVDLAYVALVLEDCGKWDEAERLMRKSCAEHRRVLGPDHFRTLSRISELAVLLHARSNWAETESLFREAVEGQRKALPPEHADRAVTLCAWANYLLDKGDGAEAERALRQALQIQRSETLGLIPEHADIGQTLAALGWALTQQSRGNEGEPLLRQGLDICRKALPAGDRKTAHVESLLGWCLTGLGQYQEAEPFLLSGYQALETAPGAPPPRRQQALDRIVELYEAWGKPDRAAAWRAKRTTVANRKEPEDIKSLKQN